ncbi:translocation/assembly module TamB domain-containing protein [Phenylobacterium sp.]|uniref:translocation/assembly module TamB domain-containing protein n=1 Tax=Phenylobacterium sp. TaxID=1871053 RepID=UPI002730FBCC|nr:translocation/assembly module TamB domain-containing protein [Phenylobacterium sp.]MDP2213742.1 translocation/assembly module TamB domain-containing protein [Phenylobacterium sp.]
MSADLQPEPEVQGRRRPRLKRRLAVGVLVLMALTFALFAAVRFGAMAPPTMGLIEARTDGLAIGRFGNLKVEGLSGDLFRDLRIRRLTITDEEGVWLEAENIALQWNYLELLRRRFHAERLTADEVRLLRRPTLTPKRDETGGMPVRIVIDQAALRLALSPEFSYERGLYDVTARLDVRRRGRGQSGELRAQSLLRPGDHLNVTFDMGPRRPLLVDVKALEAQGGAIAGALGLPADRPFQMDVDATGAQSEGRFEATAQSGGDTPLRASGGWNRLGGRAVGRLALDASRLTEPLAARLGPEVRFDIQGQGVDDGLYNLTARLESANLNARAIGQGNLGERRTGPQGLSLTVETEALSRLTGGPDAGAARLTGVLRGAADELTFDGDVRASSLAAGGYALDTVSGPVTLTRNRRGVVVEAELRGAGGAGDGYLAALAGPQPTADLAIERFADGRLLLRRLNATGQGLAVEARGTRGLLSGLNARGTARFSNLAAARAGASGQVALTWSADRAGGQTPWTLRVDGRGSELGTGYAQLDRLLGPAPQLRVRGRLDGGRVGLEEGRLNGRALDADAAGVYGPDGQLRFKIDWKAEGPLQAGPAEFSGKADGTGALTGSLAAPRLDLTARFDEVDLPRLPLRDAQVTLSFGRSQSQAAAGQVTLVAESQYGPARGRADFVFPESGVDLREIAVDAGGVQLLGDVSLRRSVPSRADLRMAIGPGALLSRGAVTGRVRIVDGVEAPMANLDLNIQDAVPVGSDLAIVAGRLTAQGPLDQLAYDLNARGGYGGERWDVAGQGALAEADAARTLTFMGRGGYGGRQVSTVQPAIFRFGEGVRSARVLLGTPDGGRVNIEGRLAGALAEVEAQITNLGLDTLNPDLAGRVNANLSLSGRDGELVGSLGARLTDARGRGSPRAQGLDGVLEAVLNDDMLNVKAEVSNEQGLRAEADLALPAEASARPFRLALDRRKPVRGRFFADGDVEPLWALLVDGDRTLAGRVQVNGEMGGTLADPTLSGRASLEGGRFDDAPTGLSLRNLVVSAVLSERVIDVSQARGVDGSGGRVDGSGQISLYRGGVSGFRLRLDDFRLIDNDIAQADASGEVTINRNEEGKVRLSGDLQVTEAEVAADPPTPSGVVTIDVVERNRSLELDLRQNLRPQTERRGEGWALDVRLKAPRGVFLRGRGLDLEMSLDARVTGSTARPILSGEARVVRGDYEFAGKRFQFDSRGVVYLSTSPESIRLDLTATRDDPALTAVIRVSGTAARPSIRLTSTPVLPDDEVLSQVLFGRSASQLSTIEAAQLAAALSSLAGGGGFDIVGNLREFAGLDRLSLGGDESSGVTVAGGKYLTDDVYLEIIGGGRDSATAQVEWQVRRNLSIVSRLTGEGDSRLSVRWRRDY